MNKAKVFNLIAIVVLSGFIIGKYVIKGQTLPEVPKLKLETDSIQIETAEKKMELVKKGEFWYLKDGDYRAVDRLANEMVDKVKTMTLFDVISKTKKYSRYELDEKQAVKVTLKSGPEVLRTLYVGKQSPGMNQSYVRFDDDPTVYLAGSFLQQNFVKDVNEIRSKEIVNYPAGALEKLSLNIVGHVYNFNPVTVKDEEKGTTATLWTMTSNATSAVLAQEKTDAIIAALAPLRATGFVESVNAPKGPICTMELTGYGKTVTLTMYDLKGEKFVVATSESHELYTIEKEVAEKFLIETFF